MCLPVSVTVTVTASSHRAGDDLAGGLSWALLTRPFSVPTVPVIQPVPMQDGQKVRRGDRLPALQPQDLERAQCPQRAPLTSRQVQHQPAAGGLHQRRCGLRSLRETRGVGLWGGCASLALLHLFVGGHADLPGEQALRAKAEFLRVPAWECSDDHPTA